MWDQVGLSHCWHDGLVTARDEAPSDEATKINHVGVTNVARQTLTGESWFHISTPLRIEPRSLMAGSKRVDHWTSGTVCECSEIAGSPQEDQSMEHQGAILYYRSMHAGRGKTPSTISDMQCFGSGSASDLPPGFRSGSSSLQLSSKR